jgi:RNA polymerase sigma-70 factor (ECF subfamily)
MLQIILAIKNENERMLVEEIYETYEKHMYMIAFGILHNQQDAEDAVNNTVIKIIRYIDKFVDISCKETKRLIVIYTRSVAFNMYKLKKRKLNFSLPVSDDEDTDYEIRDEETSLEDIVINDETISIVRKSIEKLDVKYRDVIILKYYHHLKNAQIADILGISESAVNSRLTRARQLIKKGNEDILYARLN